MKKRLLICVIVLAVLFSACSSSVTIPVEDAHTIDAKTRAMLSVSDDIVVRMYLGYFMYGFSAGQTLEETFNDGWSVRYTMYVVASEEKDGTQLLTTKWVENGAVVEENELLSKGAALSYINGVHEHNLELYELCNDTARILGVLGPDVIAYKTVCMNGYRIDDMFIYYRTNIGEYVYYRPLDGNPVKEYLVPLKEFRKYAKVVMEHRSESCGGVSGMGDYDLSPYDLSNYTASYRRIRITVRFCSIPVLLVIGGGVWFIMRKKTRE